MRIHRVVIEQVPPVAEIIDVHVIPVIRMATVRNIVSTVERRTHVNHNRVECVLFLEMVVDYLAYTIDGYHVIDLEHRAVLLRLIGCDVEEGAVDVEHQVRRILDNPALLGECRVALVAKSLPMIRLDAKRLKSQRLHGESGYFWNVNGIMEEEGSVMKNNTRLIDDHILQHLLVISCWQNDTVVLAV